MPDDKYIERALEPCPFCGSSFKLAQEPHDNHPVAGMWYIFHDYGPLGSAARQCLLNVSKHFATADEAITAWNTRAHARTLQEHDAQWRPISELGDIYQQPLWIASPHLIQGDSNPLGIADGYWQDTDGPGKGEWRTTTFDMCNDEWHTVALPKEAVTHFLVPTSPWSAEEREALEPDTHLLRGCATEQDAQGEPVAWMYDGPDGQHYIHEHRDVAHYQLIGWGWTETPLYAVLSTKPQQQPQADWLTEEAQRVAKQLNEALVNRDEQRFRTVAFVHRHTIIAALEKLREAGHG